MTLRRWIGLIILVALVVVTSGKIVSTAANQVPKSNAGEEKVRVHIPIPAETTPQDSTAVDNGDSDGSDSEESVDGVGSSETTDNATSDETTAGDKPETQPGETSEAGQPSTTDGAGAPSAQGAIVVPKPSATVVPAPTITLTSPPVPVQPTPTSTSAPTATPVPPVPGNVVSTGVPPAPVPGIGWFVDGCVSATAGVTSWDFVPSAQAGVLTAAISNGQAGAVLDCVITIANTGTTPITITGVVADFDPAVFALDAGLTSAVTLQPCVVDLPFGTRPDGVPESCWTVVPLTIRIGSAVAQDWIGIGVALVPGD
jgi:hypothetical protein